MNPQLHIYFQFPYRISAWYSNLNEWIDEKSKKNSKIISKSYLKIGSVDQIQRPYLNKVLNEYGLHICYPCHPISYHIYNFSIHSNYRFSSLFKLYFLFLKQSSFKFKGLKVNQNISKIKENNHKNIKNTKLTWQIW